MKPIRKLIAAGPSARVRQLRGGEPERVAHARPGDHRVRVRATDADGNLQTDVERDVLPDGATGLDEVDFSATDTSTPDE